MSRRVTLFCLVAVLVVRPVPLAVAPAADVVHAAYGYCEYRVSAGAYLYADNELVGSADGSGVYLDAEVEDDCVAIVQQYALFYAGEACGSYEPGEAYAIVEWHVWWEFEELPGSPILQQYDCGDV